MRCGRNRLGSLELTRMLTEEGCSATVGEIGAGLVVMRAAGPCESMVHFRVRMNGHVRIVLEAVRDLLLRFRRDIFVLACDMQHQRFLDFCRFAELVLNVHAVIADRRVGVGACRRQVGEQPAEAIADCTDLAGQPATVWRR